MHADATANRISPINRGKRCEFATPFDSKTEQISMMKETIIQEGDFLNNVVISDRPDSIYPKESIDEIIIIFDSGCTSHVSS